jgi:hypothetical protein
LNSIMILILRVCMHQNTPLLIKKGCCFYFIDYAVGESVFGEVEQLLLATLTSFR